MSLLQNSNAISEGGDYNLENSLRFRSSASAYLSRTYGTPTSARIFTLSMWVKRGKLGVFQQLYSGYTDSTNRGFIGFQSGDFIACYVRNSGGDLYEFSTPAVFRDASAWYHVIVAFDTTQATATNRVKVYVNGVQQTLTLTTTTQNVDLSLNTSGSGKSLGQSNGLEFLDGYMTEVNFVDGQQLTASDFGEYNATTGVWQPIEYIGTYGTNGFYLPMNQTVETYDATYLVVAGGGGGGLTQGGGGGAGGLLTGTSTLVPGEVYTATVGNGGAVNSGNGANSLISGTGVTVTSIGGGGGAVYTAAGKAGGSGGGGGGYTATGYAGGSGTAGQGNAGGHGSSNNVSYRHGGGGGGAGAVGVNASSVQYGTGGNGLQSSITGTATYYAGGGGGNYANGGLGGGGSGATGSAVSTSGTANTGGGGGGGNAVSGIYSTGATGGSGVVILRVPTAKYTGTVTGSPTVTTDGSDTVVKFTASGSYTA